MVQSVSRSPRAWLAVVGVLALLAAGLPSAAHAAGEDTIIGTVVVPAGVDVNDLVVEAYRADGESWRRATWADPEVDGSFALTGLATDLGYRVRVLSYDDGYAGGFYAGAGSQPGRGPDDGVSVRTGQAGITLSLITTVELTATYTLPPGFEWRSVWDTKDRLVSFAAEEYALDGTGWRSKSVWATVGRDGDGTVTFTGLRPDAGYRIHASDTDLSYAARFPKGYYREGVGTLIEREEFATPVRIGQTPHLNIGWTLVQPKPNLVAAPQLSGQAVVGSTVTASTGTWAPADVDVAYEWLRDGVVVPGAAGPQLALTAADAGASIAVRVTASRQYFDARSATSAATRVAGLAAPRAKSSPKVKGTARLGATVRATGPTWNLAGVATRYQWLRGGKAIKGATSAKYKLTTADVGKRISVRATGRLAGHEDGVASSSSKKVAKGKPKVTAKASSVKAGTRAKVVVRVKTAGLAKPTGTLTVKLGSQTVKAKLSAKRKGKITVRLPRLRAGTYTIKVSFKPSKKAKKLVTKASSKKVVLRVR